MDEFVFAGLVMFAVTLLAMGVMDALAVIITTLSKALRHHTGGARGPPDAPPGNCVLHRAIRPAIAVFDQANNGGDNSNAVSRVPPPAPSSAPAMVLPIVPRSTFLIANILTLVSGSRRQ